MIEAVPRSNCPAGRHVGLDLSTGLRTCFQHVVKNEGRFGINSCLKLPFLDRSGLKKDICVISDYLSSLTDGDLHSAVHADLFATLVIITFTQRVRVEGDKLRVTAL